MNFFYRAVMYVTRKIGKSILLFVLLFAIATFVLTGISIKDASQTASANLRESLGGRFTIYIDMSTDNPYIINERTEPSEGGKGSVNIYSTGPLLSTEMLETIKSVNGIKSYYASEMWQPQAVNFHLLRGKLPIKDGFDDMVNALAVSGTETSDFFTSGSIQLSAGRHIEPKDQYVAIISSALAEENELKIGDTLQMELTQSVASQLDLPEGEKTELTIVGLFDPVVEEKMTEMTSAYNMIENRVFTDIYTKAAFFKNDTELGFGEALFLVNDPGKLDTIVEQVKGLDSIDWKQFNVTADNKTYDQAVAPLNNLNQLVKAILMVMIAISIVILSLILTLWMRNRVYETGVFLALGIGKSNIVGQYLMEVLLLAVIAFGGSYFSANAVAERVGNSLLQKQLSQNEQSEKMSTAVSSVVIGDSVTGTEVLNKIEVNVNRQNLIQLWSIGTIIIIFSVGISSVVVMRLKPREIFSKMS
ncbi:FtsX-like permease family protein [compost metagenome]